MERPHETYLNDQSGKSLGPIALTKMIGYKKQVEVR